MSADTKVGFCMPDVSAFFTWFTQEWSTLFTMRNDDAIADTIKKNLPAVSLDETDFTSLVSVGVININKKAKNPEYLEVYVWPKRRDHTFYEILQMMRREYDSRRSDPVFDNVTMIFDIPSTVMRSAAVFNTQVVFAPFFNREKRPEIKVLLFIGVVDTATHTADTLPLEEYTANAEELNDARLLYGRSWTPSPDDDRVSSLIQCIGFAKYHEHAVVRFINGNDFAPIVPVANIKTYFEKLEKIKKKCTYCGRSEIYIRHLGCAQCKTALYCGKMCQVNDFERHSMTCEKQNDIAEAS